jgi:cysteine desulfurase
MLPYFSEEYGNAQSVHSFGQRAKSAVERARRQVAALISASPSEVSFVSGGTEADNLAIRGIVAAHRLPSPHILTTTIEHPAVLATCKALEAAGTCVTYVDVNGGGLVDPGDVRRALKDETVLVSIMHANNETGVIQPLEEIAEIIGERRSRGQPLYFHTDAVQSVGKIPVNVRMLGVDLLSISAHKLHGPKGVGALYIKKGVRIDKQMTGGHHERDRRAGTENVAGIVGFGDAAELAWNCLDERSTRMRAMRDNLENHLSGALPSVKVNGNTLCRVPNISNLSFAEIDGESLLIALDLKGIAVSTGSACSSGSLEPSHVLKAMGLTREQVRGSLRLSLSALTTPEEIGFTLRAIQESVVRMREMRPAEADTLPV